MPTVTEPPSVTYAEALELALCFGWIDSQKRGLDERHFLQRFTPRRPGGRWSKINREKAEAESRLRELITEVPLIVDAEGRIIWVAGLSGLLDTTDVGPLINAGAAASTIA